MIKSLSMLFLALTMSCFTAWAEGDGTKENPYVLVNGGKYNDPMEEWYAVFTLTEDVTEDGICIEITANNRKIRAYSDADRTKELEMKIEGNFSPYTYTLPISKGTAKGTSIYFNKPLDIQSSGTFSVTFGVATELQLISVSPEDKSSLSASEGHITWEFNKNVTVKGCRLKVADKEESIPIHFWGRFAGVDLKTKLIDLFNEGMKEGDEISLTLLEVTTEDKSASLGDITTKYYSAAKPIMLVNQKNTPGYGMNTLLTWIPENSDQGIVTLTFDGNISTRQAPKVFLGCGEIEYESSYYYEPITPTIKGNEITIDLRGKLRTIASMGLNKEYDKITLSISGVKDTKGEYAYSTEPGALGGYSFTYELKNVEYELTREFTPANGSLEGKAFIELWVNEVGDGKFTYTAARFSYKENGVDKSIDIEASKIEDTTDKDGRILNIPVPAFTADANTPIYLTLVDLSTPDGKDHSKELTAVFGDVPDSIDGIRPANASSLSSFDLNGRIAAPSAGVRIVIKDGKKVLK